MAKNARADNRLPLVVAVSVVLLAAGFIGSSVSHRPAEPSRPPATSSTTSPKSTVVIYRVEAVIRHYWITPEVFGTATYRLDAAHFPPHTFTDRDKLPEEQAPAQDGIEWQSAELPANPGQLASLDVAFTGLPRNTPVTTIHCEIWVRHNGSTPQRFAYLDRSARPLQRGYHLEHPVPAGS